MTRRWTMEEDACINGTYDEWGALIAAVALAITFGDARTKRSLKAIRARALRLKRSAAWESLSLKAQAEREYRFALGKETKADLAWVKRVKSEVRWSPAISRPYDTTQLYRPSSLPGVH